MKANSSRRILIGCGALASVAILCGCGAILVNVFAPVAGSSPLAATVPPATPAPPTSTPEPTGGLGATRAWWEREHRRTGEESLWQIFDDKRYLVIFIDDRAQNIEKRFGQGVTLVESEVERQAAELLPTDAVFVEAYQPDAVNTPETHVMVYTSAWLAGVFDEAQWYGADPGTFIVLYHVYDGGVTNLIISTGNNP